MRRLRGFGLGALGLVILAGVWELYKAFGPANGLVVGGRAITPRTGDRAMPHLWEMVTRLGEPATGRRGDPLWVGVLEASGFSLRIAAALDRGELPDIAAALVKDVGTTFEADVIDEVRRVVEVPPTLDSPDPLGRALAEAQLHQPGFTLRGGTNEILKGIVARGLGLR